MKRVASFGTTCGRPSWRTPPTGGGRWVRLDTVTLTGKGEASVNRTLTAGDSVETQLA